MKRVVKKGTFTNKDVTIKACERAYNGFFKLDKVTFDHKRFDGGMNYDVVREVVQRQDAVGVLLYDPKRDEILLIEQIRIPLYEKSESPWTYEIVAGIMDQEGEDREALARREALEEAGVTIDQLIPMHHYFSSTGGSTEQLFLYLGICSLENAGGVFGVENEHEDIRAFTLAREEAFQLLDQNRLDNASTLIALLWFRQNYQKFQEETHAN